MSKPKFSVGDVVRIIYYPNGLDHRKRWLNTVSEIEDVIKPENVGLNDWFYTLKDTKFIWAEPWLQPASIRPSIDQLL